MPGLAIPPAVLDELQRQMNQELTAAHEYTALMLWCADQNLKGFAGFFRKQAAEEREHAQKIMEHLVDRGVLPVLGPLEAPHGKFAGLLEVARHAQKMEQANTAGVRACLDTALREKDYPAQVLMHWFIAEQVEEEAWTDEMVQRVQNAGCDGAYSDLDRHIQRYLSEPTLGKVEE